MSQAEIIQGWALPSGAVVPGVERLDLDGRAMIEWPRFDRVGALRMVDSLRASRASLLERSADSIAGTLGAVGARFLDSADPIFGEAVRAVTAESGLSAEMSRYVVRSMARDWTAERLRRMVREDFGDPAEIDGFVDRGGRRIGAFGDTWALHLVSGSVPGVAATSLIRSLLVKTPVLLKPGAGDVGLTVLLARALAEADQELADAVAVTYWPGGEGEAEETLLGRADRVVVYGGDATIASVRGRTAPGAAVVQYGHRIGFSVVGPGAFDADALAAAIGTFDQRGCVTTHHLFVLGGDERVSAVADQVASGLERLESRLPRGRLREDEASAVRQRVETDELRSDPERGVRLVGGVSMGWAVSVDPDQGLEPGPGGRTVRVVSATSVDQITADLSPARLHLQTAGYGGFDSVDEVENLAERLGRVGVTRVVPFASVAFPPGWWLHDGDGPLEALVRRTELEVSEEG